MLYIISCKNIITFIILYVTHSFKLKWYVPCVYICLQRDRRTRKPATIRRKVGYLFVNTYYCSFFIYIRFANASRDARKMFGDVVPGDITHQDVILQYGNHFKEAFRNLPRNLGMEDKKYEVWQMVADIMMVSIFL